jgi:hypothetical protein
MGGNLAHALRKQQGSGDVTRSELGVCAAHLTDVGQFIAYVGALPSHSAIMHELKSWKARLQLLTAMLLLCCMFMLDVQMRL